MKNIFSKKFDISSQFRLRTISKVEELMNHDMIYIYHHLNIGSELKLLFAETRLNGDLRYSVYYKDFKLGYITIGGFIKEMYSTCNVIYANISSLSSEKYLPTNRLDIELQPKELKKVS